MASFSGPAIVVDAEKAESVSAVGFDKALPPHHAGNASKFLTSSFGGGLSVSPGINFILMTSSSGWKSELKSGVVLAL